MLNLSKIIVVDACSNYVGSVKFDFIHKYPSIVQVSVLYLHGEYCCVGCLIPSKSLQTRKSVDTSYQLVPVSPTLFLILFQEH